MLVDGESPLPRPSSVLFDEPEGGADLGGLEPPDFLTDLNLDQVLASITAGREEYDLAPYFYVQLERIEAIRYRQEVFRDLENSSVLASVTSFAQRMRDMYAQLAQAADLRVRHQRQAWFRDAVATYCEAVGTLADELAPGELRSRGLVAFRAYLVGYVESAAFTSLVEDTRRMHDALATVRYAVQITGLRVRVRKYEAEADYSTEVVETFARFQHGAAKDYRVGFHDAAEMNSVEEQILDRVARVFSDVFAGLEDYSDRHRDYLDDTLRTFDREVQFYVAYLEHIGRLGSTGLRFCLPEVSRDFKRVLADETFDVALASTLVAERQPVVLNDFFLAGPERILVVSGPNQGGKTTFARTFGQLHYLANLGCPVPGRRARLFHFDRLFTHFGRAEDLSNFTGKLEDDLIRMRDILAAATTNSVLVVNEIFASTTFHDALILGTKVVEQIIELDLLCVVVTFVDELASLDESTVSMMSTVVPGNPSERTYKVVRKPADGRAYAIAIAEKYGLTYERLKGRIA